MANLVIGLIIFIIVCVAISAHKSKYGIGDARVQFKRGESGTSVSTGRGKSLGEAMADGFKKLYTGLSPNSRLDTIQSRYDAMVQNLSENRNRMFQRDIATCEDYISRTRLLLDEKKKHEAEKLAEKGKSDAEKLAERKQREAARSAERRRKETAKLIERKKKEAAMPEQRRFVAEQRRLMTDALRYEILSRDGFRCQICGATAQDGYKLHVDHIIPVSKGGRTEPDNLRTLCERCNMGKGDKIETPKLSPEQIIEYREKQSESAEKLQDERRQQEMPLCDLMVDFVRKHEMIARKIFLRTDFPGYTNEEVRNCYRELVKTNRITVIQINNKGFISLPDSDTKQLTIWDNNSNEKV